MTLLLEKQLTHLTHLEDLLFLGADKSITSTVNILTDIVDTLSGTGSMKTQQKVDGAPSIVIGRDPENKKFFVATKSLFNKTPKINYTTADIDANHGHAPVLAQKMKEALKHCSKLKLNATAIQGDFMFSVSDFSTTKIDGESYLTFTPNTITYAVPKDDPFASELKSKKIGIAWHTTYTGSSITSLSASFDIKAPKSTKDVWSTDTNVDVIPKSVLLTAKEQKEIRSVITKLSKIRLSPSFMKEYITSNSPLLLQFINFLVKEGKMTPSIKDFERYIIQYYDNQANKLKSDKGKAKKYDVRDKALADIKPHKVALMQLFNVFGQIVQVKELLVSKLNKIGGLKTFQKTDKGFEVTNPEGFVMISADKQNAIKMISRLEFSKNNFLAGKMR